MAENKDYITREFKHILVSLPISLLTHAHYTSKFSRKLYRE